MSETRPIYQVPVQILQDFISILRANERFSGEGKVDDFYIVKNEKLASIIYDNGKVSFVANFVKDKEGNWFFIERMAIRDSLKGLVAEKPLPKSKA